MKYGTDFLNKHIKNDGGGDNLLYTWKQIVV